ncbi:MAG: tRNA lysidine(34) synthetase TilS [Balneolaceae bacterium]|nr:tRNA lysidine(34) synthetase TilS [Balneolaceae bacterium]MBO6546060.1 tRNA lysidine(34) synthetase TilS [Balneolaceae bacterium]MBO6647456.1 tRNA lysidine(34) synthetase TilS [Balneolaceae bacterium]
MNKSASESIEKSVKSSLNHLKSTSPYLILGVSGGPDSMALLYTLFKLNVNVFVIHINYSIRGESSNLDQELVEGMSAEWGFECCSVKLDSKKAKGNFQNWAREERYRIFRELKEELQADTILTAHHQDDQIETILQRLFRGSGPQTWKGLSLWDGELLRPLLTITKKEVLKYCEEEAIPFRIDESNLESKYARNFLRNEFSESMDEFFPGWKENILGLREKGRLTEAAVNHIYKEVLKNSELNLQRFSELSEELKTSILKTYIEDQVSGMKLSKGLILELLKVESLQAGTSVAINDQYSLMRGRGMISIHNSEESGILEVSLSKEKVEEGFSVNNLAFNILETREQGLVLSLDSDKLNWPLTLRGWKNGDRFQPFGMDGSQKISDHLTNKKIPSVKKEKALILSGADSTIYAIIFPQEGRTKEIGSISETAKCTDTTMNFFTIKLK